MSVAALVGCGASPPTGELAEERQPIIAGSPAPVDLQKSLAQLPACSGVVLAPNLVLTARHCVWKWDPTPGGFCNPLDETMSMGTFTTPIENLPVLRGTSVHADPEHPDFSLPDARVAKILVTEELDRCKTDIAALILDRDLPDAAPLPVALDAAYTPEVGDTVMTAGYGVKDYAGLHSPSALTTQVDVLYVGPGFYTAAGGETPVTKGGLLTSPGPCSGDSGSPLLRPEDQGIVAIYSWLVGGATSGIDKPYAYCNESSLPGAFTLMSHSQLVVDAYTQAGATPFILGQELPDDLGKSCSAQTDCFGKVCIDVGSGPFCSRECDAERPCSEGYSCSSAGDRDLCLPAEPSSGDDSSGCAVRGADPGAGTGWVGVLLAACALGLSRRARRARAPE